jgi:hypothetical protein
MKRLLLLLIIIILSKVVVAQKTGINTGISLDDPSLTVTPNFALNGQWKVGDGNHAKEIVYDVKDFGMGQIRISNIKNIFEYKAPKKTFDNLRWVISDKFDMSKIFKQVFTEERMNHLMDDNDEFSIIFTLRVSTVTGELAEVDFILRMKTLITPFELEGLENGLKDIFKVKFSSPAEGGDYVQVSESYRFSNALEGKKM